MVGDIEEIKKKYSTEEDLPEDYIVFETARRHTDMFIKEITEKIESIDYTTREGKVNLMLKLLIIEAIKGALFTMVVGCSDDQQIINPAEAKEIIDQTIQQINVSYNTLSSEKLGWEDEDKVHEAVRTNITNYVNAIAGYFFDCDMLLDYVKRIMLEL